MATEYAYRQSLDAYSQNRITKENCDKSLKLQARVINERVKDDEPELKALALKYETKNPYW